MKRSLSEKELIFCYFFVETGNLRKALSIAKIDDPEKNLPRLMSNKMILDQISKNYENRRLNLGIKSELGYEKLAFNDITDCVRLMFMKDINDFQNTNMNLFNISEIKRLKDGTMEIKFFDRIKALEKLQSIESSKSESDLLSFYDAIKNAHSSSGDENGN